MAALDWATLVVDGSVRVADNADWCLGVTDSAGAKARVEEEGTGRKQHPIRNIKDKERPKGANQKVDQEVKNRSLSDSPAGSSWLLTCQAVEGVLGPQKKGEGGFEGRVGGAEIMCGGVYKLEARKIVFEPVL